MFDDELDEVLRKTALFSQLSAEEREEMEAIGRVVRARAGSTLIRQGDEAGGMSVVVAGRVRIELELPDGRRETLATLSRGDVFGELSLVDRFPRSASAVADSDARVFLINGTEFDRLRHGFRPAAYKILRAIGPILCKRVRGVDRAIAERLFEQRHEAGGEGGEEKTTAAEGAAAGGEPPAAAEGSQRRLDFDELPSLMGTPTPPPLPPLASDEPSNDEVEGRVVEDDGDAVEEVIELPESSLSPDSRPDIRPLATDSDADAAEHDRSESQR